MEHGGSTGHSASGNLRRTTGLRSDLLQAPGRMLGLMWTTLFFILHCALLKSSSVWQFSAPFVSLHLSSVQGGWLETVGIGAEWGAPSCGSPWRQCGKTQDCLPLRSSGAHLGTLQTPPLPLVVKAGEKSPPKSCHALVESTGSILGVSCALGFRV